ncbi:MAG TPA: cupin domain-containing protein [Candidatus Binatia bacterium]|nr:cupin domain-containing protein [Candidatus Binatia bacterium]
MQATQTKDLARAWSEAHVRPLWEIPLAHAERTQPPRAHLWEWRILEPLVLEALNVTSPDAVERRVLSLIDPGAAGGEFHTTTNLNAAFQILKPGESARPHRHSMNALRFILKGSGATTTVDGKVCPMAEGDLLLTPGWTWHEHKHSGDAPIVWLDVLDVALHLYFGTDRFEPGPVHDVPELPREAAFASANVVPADVANHGYSPVFHYPLADAVAAARHAPKSPDGTRRVRYINPLTGGTVMSTLDCYLVALDPDVDSVPFRTTANAVCAIVSGSGTTTVGDQRFAWHQRDVLSLPHGHWITHRAAGEPAYLFVVTDRDVYRRLDILTEEYHADSRAK